MTDRDDFDRLMSDRLRASESRVPGGLPPQLTATRASRSATMLRGVAVAGTAVAALVAVVLLLAPGEQSPIGGESSRPRPSSPGATAAGSGTEPSPTGRAAPTGTSIPEPGGAISWTLTAELGDDGGVTAVNDVIAGGPGVVAVGVHYPDGLPVVGPRPRREGRVWVSRDGLSWQSVASPATFASASFNTIVARPDGSLLVLGTVEEPGDSIDARIQAAWESTDGTTWTSTSIGLPGSRTVRALVHGTRGYLALTEGAAGADAETELWLSADARAWELVLGHQGLLNAGAGEEGFVVTGALPATDSAGDPFALASADGREWTDAPLPADMAAIVPVGEDWYAMSWLLPDEGPQNGSATVWFSANGIDWEERGGIELDAVDQCREWAPLMTSAYGLLFLHTSLTFPCSEGGVQRFGSQYMSRDGVSWERLPLDEDSRHLFVEFSDGLVGAGTTADAATFWLGEQR